MPPRLLAALRNASLTFGGRPTFTDVTVNIGKGERICLVGRNGSGKSTLLKAIAGSIDLDHGERFLQPGTTLAYMRQDAAFESQMTALAYVAEGLVGAETLETARHRVEAALDEAGIAGDRLLAGLSGGETRRVSLARAFVGEPDILLLDEPTNHLDIPAIEGLESRLATYPGAVVLISHDRALLNHLAQRVIWLDRGRARMMEKGFEAFDEWSEGILAQEEAEQNRLDKKLAVETLWMRQGISARRTRNMGRVRALQQLRRDRAQRVKIRDAKLGEAQASEAVGQIVMECEGLAKSLPDPQGVPRPIVANFSTKIMRGDRVGIVGPNGAGKSTLLKLLTGSLKPDAGRIKRAQNLTPAYFDQHRAELDGEKTVRQNLVEGGDTIFVQGQPRHIMGYLRDFLFEERQAQTPVKRLSGGERNRLLLAKVLAQPSNLLVLDEPTNDLDMETLDLLEELLANYDGTLLLVSHDRDFLDRLVTTTLAVEGGGDIAEYVGGWSDYVRQRSARQPEPTKSRDKPKPVQRNDGPAKPRFGFKEKRELDLLTKTIDALTREKSDLEKTIADSELFSRDRARFDAAMRRMETVGVELEMAEEQWLDLELKRAELEG